MENEQLAARVRAGLERLNVGLLEQPSRVLARYARELLKWNERVNLTSITELDEVAEKHLVDSLAVLPEVPEGARSLLDLGAGAGLPGIPLAVARPELSVVLVDAVAKKVGFIKHAAAQLGLAPRVKGVHGRALGHPATEGLPLSDVVISRALMDVGPWLALARSYLNPGGRVVAMLGRTPEEEVLRAAAEAAGLELGSVRRYALPFSGDPRGVAVFHVEHPGRQGAPG